MEGKKLRVESICATLPKAGLQVAPSTYYAAKNRHPSARAVREAEPRPVPRELSEANYQVYGVRRLWKAAQRAGWDVGRDQTNLPQTVEAAQRAGWDVGRDQPARLMRAEGAGFDVEAIALGVPPGLTRSFMALRS